MNDKHKLLVNGALFGVTASALFLYAYAYFVHVSSGLVPSIWDKLILLCTLISTIFYGMSLHASYLHYTRNQLSIVLNSPTSSPSSSSASSTASPTPSTLGSGSVGGASTPIISQLMNQSPTPVRKQRSSVDFSSSSSSSGGKEMIGLGMGSVIFGNREKRTSSEDLV